MGLYLGVKFLISKEFVRGYGSFVRLFSCCLLKNTGKDKTGPGWWEGGGWWPATGVRSHEQAPPVMTVPGGSVGVPSCWRPFIRLTRCHEMLLGTHAKQCFLLFDSVGA